MKRILFMMMCVMACAACGREEESNYDRVIWEYTPLTINLAIHSTYGNEYINNPEYIKSVEIEWIHCNLQNFLHRFLTLHIPDALRQLFCGFLTSEF